MKLKFWCHKYDNTLIWFDYFGPSEPPQPRQWFGLSAGAARIFLWTSYMAQKNHMHSIRSRVPSDANETCECLHSTIPINLEKTNVCPNFSSMYQVNEHNQDFFFCTKTVRHAFAPEVFLTLNIPTGGYLAWLRMQLVHSQFFVGISAKLEPWLPLQKSSRGTCVIHIDLLGIHGSLLLERLIQNHSWSSIALTRNATDQS